MCTKPESAKSEATVSQTAGIAVLKAENSQVESSILPSLTATIKNETIHALLDSGCQGNFIKEELVSKYNLKILQSKIPLSINGVNDIKNYKTYQVLVPIKIGNSVHEIKCFTLPELNLKIKVPGIKSLVKKINQLGCELADTTLYELTDDCFKPFDLILGISNFVDYKIKSCYVGQANLWEANDGLILLGNLQSLEDEVDQLNTLVSLNNQFHE